ncbi:MAG: HDIG domain-containing protein, partial [Desulfobulbus sp.]|nr:HDIG domain-containing protein [Desulfobulbus sp.]
MNTTCPALTPTHLDRLRTLSASFCLVEGGAHGPDHSERVLQTALALGRRMGARLEILVPAALLHDIGRRDESRSQGGICHAERGAQLAVPLLREL